MKRRRKENEEELKDKKRKGVKSVKKTGKYRINGLRRQKEEENEKA